MSAILLFRPCIFKHAKLWYFRKRHGPKLKVNHTFTKGSWVDLQFPLSSMGLCAILFDVWSWLEKDIHLEGNARSLSCCRVKCLLWLRGQSASEFTLTHSSKLESGFAAQSLT